MGRIMPKGYKKSKIPFQTMKPKKSYFVISKRSPDDLRDYYDYKRDGGWRKADRVGGK